MKNEEGLENVYIYRGESKDHEFITPTALRDGAFDDPRTAVNKYCLERYEYSKHIFNGPVLDSDLENRIQFNNLFLPMSEYQHLTVLSKEKPNVYLPSIILDFTESKEIAECFASNYGYKKIIYRVNYSRINELLSFRPDLYNAFNSEKDAKMSDINISLLSVVHWCESSNELTRKENAINIFWSWKIAKSEIEQTYPKDTLGYILNIETVK